MVQSFVDTLPDAPTRTFCSWYGPSRGALLLTLLWNAPTLHCPRLWLPSCRLNEELDRTQACDYLSLLYYGLTSGGDLGARDCDPAKAAARQADSNWGSLPPQPLPDRRPLPPELPDVPAVYAQEGAAYWFLFQLARNAQTWAPCAPAAGLGGLALPPGWAVEGAANASQASGPPLPMVYVLHNEATNQVVLLLRPTAGPYEWSLNFAFNTVRAGGRAAFLP